MADSTPLRRRDQAGPIDVSSVRPIVSAPPAVLFTGIASSHEEPDRPNPPLTHCLLSILSSVRFISRPRHDTEIPPGWTFHLQSPRSHLNRGQGQSKRPDLNGGGYFHHAASRITTNIDITREKAPLRETNDGDEFAEIAVISLSAHTTNQSPNAATQDPNPSPVRFYVDHFNRTFGTDTACSSHENHIHPTEGIDLEAAYMEWIMLIGRHPDSHLYMPSAKPKEYSCLGRKIAQQVVWDHQNGHITKIDIDNAFSPLECTSLLSALQKKSVTDKQCQKIIRTVIDRFLAARKFKMPLIEPSLKATDEEGELGRMTVLFMMVTFLIWIGPMLSVPAAYFRRLRTIAARADGGAYLPYLWQTFIKVLLKEWTDLSIVFALVLVANVAFLALPGTSGRLESPPEGTYSATLADVSRGAGTISMLVTLTGLLTSLVLIWLHQPMLGTGSFDACKYILGSAYVQTDEQGQLLSGVGRRSTFLRLILVATYLGMPLVLLLWSTIAFVISALAWTFLFSSPATQVAVVTICGLILTTPLATIIVFWGPIISKDSLLTKATRGDIRPLG